jgi:hypothetical protein
MTRVCACGAGHFLEARAQRLMMAAFTPIGSKGMKPRLTLISALTALALALTVLPVVASAHETRTVAGKYKFVVGFLNEPALSDQPNGIDLTVTDVNTGDPVQGLEKSLKAQIIYGGESENVTLSPRFNLPGKYTASVIPTKAGTWKFHFTGKINSDSIDETFTSGPGRFNDVEAASTFQFPAKTPGMVELNAQVNSAQSTATSAQSTARAGFAAGIVGVLAGAAGLVVAGVALSRSRRPGGASAASSASTRQAA